MRHGHFWLGRRHFETVYNSLPPKKRKGTIYLQVKSGFSKLVERGSAGLQVSSAAAFAAHYVIIGPDIRLVNYTSCQLARNYRGCTVIATRKLQISTVIPADDQHGVWGTSIGNFGTLTEIAGTSPMCPMCPKRRHRRGNTVYAKQAVKDSRPYCRDIKWKRR